MKPTPVRRILWVIAILVVLALLMAGLARAQPVQVTDDKSKKLTYIIVGSTEANPSENKLSNESPVGKALVGRKQGDKVKVTLPSGKQRELTVDKIEVA